MTRPLSPIPTWFGRFGSPPTSPNSVHSAEPQSIRSPVSEGHSSEMMSGEAKRRALLTLNNSTAQGTTEGARSPSTGSLERVPLSKLAESTRKPKPLTADDVRDPESISGMKCQVHWDREKAAQKRALLLLDASSMV